MKHRPITWGLLAWAILLLICGGCGGKPIPIPPPPPGRVCAIYGEPWCDCYVPITEGGLIHWEYRKCPAPSPTPAPTPAPTPSPSPTPTPTPAPSPTPGPVPSPTPSPSPSPCTPITETVPACESGYTQCWKCADRIAWDVERGNWTPLPGKPGLYYNDPGGDPAHREYIDGGCNKVDRDGRILRKLEGGCEPNWICPPDKTVTHACPSPSPSPGPSPTPPPNGGPVNCADIFLCGIGAQVHQFQNRFAQTVPYHREGDGGFIYVPDGPVLGGKVHTDSTPYYKPKVDPPGGCGPRFSCNGEGEYWGNRCIACERAPLWRQKSGPALDYHTYGEGFGIEAQLTQPGYYEFEACGEGVCKLIAFRITE